MSELIFMTPMEMTVMKIHGDDFDRKYTVDVQNKSETVFAMKNDIMMF